ncbi:unnamed protein product [Arabis nemorensis]|uniref:Uncharacterized protein n=1 Tax=Arabis nemorensis TaxID=586526 RepID=A0A565CQI3_9BRAS|nr:unnamed protein product [Arabis nemorensis]
MQVPDGVVDSTPLAQSPRSNSGSGITVAPVNAVATADPEPTLTRVVAEEVTAKPMVKATNEANSH